jgi:signal transduction histidine kinase
VAALEDIFSGRSDSYHQIYRIKTNTVMYWEESYATVSARDEEGLPTRIVGTSLRIDDQKQMEADLINARNKAEESDRLKTAFLANMGHEIRTPLNAIVGFADLLPMVDNEADRNQLISEIQINNRKLLRIIDGLVSMSKIEAEARNLIKSKTDLVELLNDVVKAFLPTIDQKTVSFSTQFPYPQLMLSTDVDKLKEIVINLLDNAIKFTQEGEIILGYEKLDDKCLRIWVKDTGIGVSEADQKKIFDRFVKLNDYIPGTGLGLAVAKSHIESLGGKIGVDSHVGEGSIFWVTLPMS